MQESYDNLFKVMCEKAISLRKSRHLFFFSEFVGEISASLEIFVSDLDIAMVVAYPRGKVVYDSSVGPTSVPMDEGFENLMRQMIRLLDFKENPCCPTDVSFNYIHWSENNWVFKVGTQAVPIFFCPSCGKRLPLPTDVELFESRNRFSDIVSGMPLGEE